MAASRRIAVVSAGLSNPSSTRMLADRLANATVQQLAQHDIEAQVDVFELRDYAHDITNNMLTGFAPPALESMINAVVSSDALIAVTPIFSTSYSGLFKSFIDVLDNDLLIGKPVILAATAGTPRHAMVVDEQLRPLFAFLRALPVPTSLFAAPDDWGSSALGDRIARAATELAVLARGGVGAAMADAAWSGYQHQFSGNATNSERSVADVDFGTDLMRLAAGGTR